MSGVRRGTMGGLLAIVVAGSPLVAQDTRSVDAGVAVLRFPEDDRHVVGPWVRGDVGRTGRRLRTAAAGSLVASPGVAAASLEAGAWLRYGIPHGLAWELGGEGTALAGTNARTSESLLGVARVARGLGTAGGAWAGMTAHVAWREAGALTGRGLQLGGWWSVSRAAVLGSVTRQWAQAQLFATEQRLRVLDVLPVRYDEATLAAHVAGGTVTLDLSAGARRDPDALRRVEPVLALGIARWTGPRSAVVIGITHQPNDFIRGADATESVSVGMRFGARPAERASAPVMRAVVRVIRLEGDARRRLQVHAAGARTVEVMGDFTGWAAVALARSGGGYTLDVVMTAGTHRLLVRVDGGTWLPPANLPTIDDDFGGRVGLLNLEP